MKINDYGSNYAWTPKKQAKLICALALLQRRGFNVKNRIKDMERKLK